MLGTSYRAEVFADYLGDGSRFGLELECVPEPEPLGTGGGIRHAAAALDAAHDEVMVFNGDILSGVDLGAVLAEHRAAGADATLHLVRVRRPHRLRVRAHRPHRPGRGVPREDAQPADRPGQRRVLRLPARGDRRDPRPGGRSAWSARPSRGCSSRGAACRGTWSRRTGSTSAPRQAFVRGCADLVQGIAPTSALPGPVGTALMLEGAKTAATATCSDGTTLGPRRGGRRRVARDRLGGDGRRPHRRQRVRRRAR